jgi:hypothetical protein
VGGVHLADDPRLAYELARVCTLAPEMTVEPEQVIRWARLALDSEPLAWHSHVVGFANYRAGDYEGALRWVGDSLERAWDAGRPLNQLVLAMIHRRMGHAELSTTLFKESIHVCEEMDRGRVDGAVSAVFAADWMAIQIYRRQVESLFTN